MSKKQAIIDGINEGKSFEEIVIESGASKAYVKKVFTENGLDWEDRDDPNIELETVIVEKEEKEEPKKDSSILGKTFKKMIPNPLVIRYISIGDEITIDEKHLKVKDFERIFLSQVEKGILKEA